MLGQANLNTQYSFHFFPVGSVSSNIDDILKYIYNIQPNWLNTSISIKLTTNLSTDHASVIKGEI